jgi:hypothetical protein
MNAALRRSLQVLAFAVAPSGRYLFGFGPPGELTLIDVLAGLLVLCALLVITSMTRSPHRQHRLWLRATISLAILGVMTGLWYHSEYHAAVFVYDGDGRPHIAGSELTVDALRLTHEDPSYASPNALLLAGAGQDERIWTAASISEVRFRLDALYLLSLLFLTISLFLALELTLPTQCMSGNISTVGQRLISDDSDMLLLGSPSPNQRACSTSDDRGSDTVFSSSTEIVSPRSMRKQIVLFLAANPNGTNRLSLDREARAIHVELERSGCRDRFEMVTRWAAEPLDLLRELRKLKPTVVHVSGHGSPSAIGCRLESVPCRDVVGELDHHRTEVQHGLFFQGSDGCPQLVSTAALKATFGAAGFSVKLVVLSACYSDVQALALLPHVGCIVGMNGTIGDDAARAFAIGFYGGLGERESIAAAYAQGCAAVTLQGLRDCDRPQLVIRDGLDANKLVLADDLPEPVPTGAQISDSLRPSIRSSS